MTNPDNFVAHRHALIRLSLHVPALAAAWSLTRERRYAAHAAAHLRAWFLDEKTRMNPNLLYAQAISGRFTGRGIGIIDTLHLVEVVRAIAVLERAEALTAAERDGVRAWFDRVPDLDDHARVRAGRARCEEQPRHLLGDAGRRVRPLHGSSGLDRVLPRPLQDRDRPRPDRRRRQLPGRAAQDQALRLFPLQPRRDGHRLPDPVDERRRLMAVRDARRPRRREGPVLPRALHRRQARVEVSSRRHVLR